MRAEEIVFWILILVVIAMVIWLAFGSPAFETSLLMIALFVAASEIVLWRFFSNIDKRTAVGFEKVKGGVRIISNDVNWIKENLKENKEDMDKIKRKLRIR